MANSISPFKKYIDKLDTVYSQSSASAVLDADAETVKMGNNAGEFLVPKMNFDGLADYDRGSGYVDGDISLTYETMMANYSRGRRFSVDAMDDEETAGVAFGKLASEFIRVKTNPELDAFRFATYAGKTGILSASAALTTGEEVLAALIAAVNAQDEAEVSTEGKVLFITPTLLTLAKNADTTKSKAILDRFSLIKSVPQPRFYTGISMLDGKTSGEEVGGFKPTVGAHPLNFLIVNKDAVLQFGKHTVNKIVKPEDNQLSDAWMFFYRAYGVAEVYENKLKGIYAHKNTTAVTE